MKKYSFIFLIYCFLISNAQDTTKVSIDLEAIENEFVSVKIYPPVEKNEWSYVIPEIIPGTYMKVNYIRFYDNVKAFDNRGNIVKVKKTNNVFTISGETPISYIEYIVKPTFGDRKFRDNVPPCAGSVYNSESALINFQVINGYFEGYEDYPFQIEVNKPKEFYGASSIKKIILNEKKDLLFADNYTKLQDNPIMYAKEDTSSFIITDNIFKLAVYSETKAFSAQQLKPKLETLMHEIESFSGLTTDEDYYFLMYFINDKFTKSGYEHKNSCTFTSYDKIMSSTFFDINFFCAHEYYHTITPLNLHSEKIADFNFKKADMSSNIWMYEGFTDYLTMMLLEQSKSIHHNAAHLLANATQTALKRSKQSMSKSSMNIIRKKNIISWNRKLLDLENFYEKGKLIAFAIDMELMEKTNGEKRLLDVMLEIKGNKEDAYFKDNELLEILEKHTYPGFEKEFKPYIVGTELPPYDNYFNKLGWTFYPKKSQLPTYGHFHWKKDIKSGNYYVDWLKRNEKNEVSLIKGDTILTVNNIPIQDFMITEFFDNETINCPTIDDTLKLKINRNGEIVVLEGKPRLAKTEYPEIKVNKDISEEQMAFRKSFFYKE